MSYMIDIYVTSNDYDSQFHESHSEKCSNTGSHACVWPNSMCGIYDQDNYQKTWVYSTGQTLSASLLFTNYKHLKVGTYNL